MKRYQQYMYSYPHKTAYRVLEGLSIKEYLKELSKQTDNGLYFHIPFCEQKCGYCNLFSVVGQSEQQMEAYLDAMERQLIAYAKVWGEAEQSVLFSSLTIGGGTPLLLNESQLMRMFELAERMCRFTDDRAYVIETSPNQTTKEKLKILKQFHVNRVSIGVQSFHEDELLTLHRRHTASQAKQALDLLRQEEFDCINLDLIYGIPKQTLKSLEESVLQALYFEPDEIFAYPLYVKHGVWLEGKVVLDEESAYQEYCLVRDMLKSAGYRQDSMRRFVRSKKQQVFEECGFGNTISVGCGGRSYLGNLHMCTPYAVKQETCRTILHQYIETPIQWEDPFGYLLSLDEQKRRYAIKHLLFGFGLSKERYLHHFGQSIEKDFPMVLEWKQMGYVEETKEAFRLTEKGRAYSDGLGPMFISSVVRVRMEQWKEEAKRI